MTISLVIPAYNEEAEIARCLDAVAKQEVPFDEVIVVDNNSTDRTVEIVQQYPFVKLLHEPKQGVDFARDAGFNAAKGDIIGRIDADTYLPTDWSKQLLRIFADPEVAAVTGSVFYKDMPAPALSQRADTAMRTAFFNHSKDLKFLFGTNMAVRRSAWEKVRDKVCHRKDVHEDIDLAIHLSDAGLKVMFDKELVAGMSLRRVNAGFGDFYKYIQMTDHTYNVHGIDEGSVTVRLPLLITLMAVYPGFKLIWRAYNPETHQFSLKKLLRDAGEARKNPMA